MTSQIEQEAWRLGLILHTLLEQSALVIKEVGNHKVHSVINRSQLQQKYAKPNLAAKPAGTSNLLVV